MIHLKVDGIMVDGVKTPDKFLHMDQHYALYTVKGPIIYFTRHQDNWVRVNESQILAGGIIHILDPITALVRGLATADEIGLGGVDTLVALLKPV